MKNKIFLQVITALVFLISFTSISAQEEEPAAAAVITKPNTQNKISLDIKGMDIIDVLKMLSMRAGMNIVVGKNVTGRVTLFLKDVDIWDAFEIIMLSNELAYEKKADIINVITQRDYELLYGERYQDKKEVKTIQLKYARAADLAVSLNQIKTNLGRVVVNEGSNTLAIIDAPAKIKEMVEFIGRTDLPVKSQIFTLNYAQADKISVKIQELLTKGVGSLKIDERTNKIAITDYPEKLVEIDKIISAFDEKTFQVLIDAQVIELKPSDKFEMGVDWDYWIKKYFEIRTSLPLNATNALLIGTLGTGSPTETGQYKGVIDLLRTIGDVKILSSPRVMALNNQEARIHVGTKEAYITSTTSQSGTGTTIKSQTVNFVDTGIELYVTPTISRDNFVTMKIKPAISDAVSKDLLSDGQKTSVPIVTSSEAETTVIVRDGVTIIIGGLRKDKREKSVRKIPLLGDIPGLGFLFRSTSDSVTKTELVILLTPHIMSGENAFTDIEELKPKDGAVAKMVDGHIITERVIQADKKESGENNISKYYDLLAAKIRNANIIDYPEGEKGVVELEFTLSRIGNLIDTPRILNTNNSKLNPYALTAVKLASPYPSFPDTLANDRETFTIALYYE